MHQATDPFGGYDILEPDRDIKSSLAPHRVIKREAPMHQSGASSTQPLVRILMKQQMYLEPHGFSKTVTIDEDHGRKTGLSLQSPSSSWTGEIDDRGSGTRQLSKLTLRIGGKQMTFRVADNPQPSRAGEGQGDWDWASRHHSTEATLLYGKNQCALCDRMFNSMEEIGRHMADSHGQQQPRSFPCNYKHCSRTFPTKNTQEEHMKKDHEPEDRPFECPVCPKRFRHSSNLNQHIKYHAPGSRHICAICGRIFRTSEMLVSHHNRCRGGLAAPVTADGKAMRFECDYCSKPFYYRRDKLIHERVHTGQRPYSCGYCGKSFTQSQACQIHIRTHTGEKPYVCKSCPKRFTDNSSLRKHEANHYIGDIPIISRKGSREREQSYEEEQRRVGGGRYHGESHLMSAWDMDGEEIVEEEIVDDDDDDARSTISAATTIPYYGGRRL